MSNGILVLHPEDPRFGKFKENLLHPTMHKLISGAQVCQNKIGEPFVRDAINEAHIIVVNLFNDVIIGFAAVIHDTDEHGNPFLYIDLICNSPPPGVETRAAAAAGQRQGAKAMIEAIEGLARSRGCSYVKLSAVDDVIPYYYRLGYDFVTVFSKTFGEINTYLKDKAGDRITALRRAQLDQNMDEQEKLLIKIIQHYYPDYLSEKYQSSVASAAGAARMEPAEDAGIPMIKKMEPIPGPAGRGGKKHKRKTIRKKYSRNKQRVMLKKSRKYRRRV